MKKNTDYIWKLGLFVTGGLILLMIGIYIIGSQKNLFNDTIRLQTVFANVNGLKIGNNVRFSGINIGTVDEIQITSDSAVTVTVIIQKEVQKFIKKDSRTNIGSDGLMGDKVLVIVPGTANTELAKENDVLQSEIPIEMDAIMHSVKNSADNMEVITDEVATLVYSMNHGKGAVSQLLKDDKFANNMNQTMENLKEGSDKLNENMEAAKGSFLLRGYFKKKKKKQEQAQKELEQKQTVVKKETEKKQR